ncbi:Prominin family protein [Acanthocheilonema viteae]
MKFYQDRLLFYLVQKMKLIAIIFLPLFNFNQVNAINISQEELSPKCLKYEINLTRVNYSFGFMDPFYNFAQNLIQSIINSYYQKKLISVILSSYNHFQADSIHHILLQQRWIIVLLILSILYIVLLPICGILFFCDLCFCATADSISSSEVLEITKKNKLAKFLFVLILIMMAIILVIIATSMIVYIRSVSYTVTGTNSMCQSMDDIYADVNLLIVATSNDLICMLNKTLRKLGAGINDTIQQLPHKIIGTLKQDFPITSLPMVIEKFEAKNVTHFIDDLILAIKSTKLLATNLPNALYRQSFMKNMIKTLERIENYLTILLQQYSDIRKTAKKTQNNVEILLDRVTERVNRTLKRTSNFIIEISKKTNLIIGKINQIIYNLHVIVRDGYQKIHKFMKTTLRAAAISIFLFAIIPVLLLIVPSIIVITCGIYLLARSDRYRWKQQANWRCAGLWSLHVAGAVFFTGWITMLIASMTFLGGFAVEAICQPFFRDEQMHLYRSSYFNNAIAKFVKFSELSVSTGEFLYQCKNDKSILTALKIETFMQSYEEMYAKYLSNATQHAKQLLETEYFNLTLSDIQMHEFNNTIKELAKLKENLFDYVIPPSLAEHEQLLNDSFANIKYRMSEMIKIMAEMEKNVIEIMKHSLNSQNFTLIAREIIWHEYNLTVGDISDRVMHAKFYLLNQSFICRPFYDTVVNIGTVFCKQFSRPIHGIWSSASLIAISFLAIMIIVLCISTFFFSLNNNFERRLRRECVAREWNGDKTSFHDGWKWEKFHVNKTSQQSIN